MIILAIIGGILIGIIDKAIYAVVFIALIPMVFITVRFPFVAVACFFFLLPLDTLFVLPGDHTLNKLLGAYLLFLCIITGKIRYITEVFNNKKVLFIILYFIAAIVSLFFTTNIAHSIIHLQKQFFLIITYFVLLVMIRDSNMLNKALWALLIGAVISVIAPVFIGSANFDKTEIQRYGGLWGDQNEFAALLLVLIPISLALFFQARKRVLKLGSLICLIIFFIGFILTYSRSGYVAFAVTFGIALTTITMHGSDKLKNFLYISLILIITVIIAYYSMNAETISRLETLRGVERIESVSAEHSLRVRYYNYFELGPKLFFSSPVFGIGYWDFVSHSPYGLISHSSYIEVLTGTGLVGFIPFILILFFTLKELRMVHKYNYTRLQKPIFFSMAKALELGFIAYLIASIFNSNDINKFFWLIITISSIVFNIYSISQHKYTRVSKNAPEFNKIS